MATDLKVIPSVVPPCDIVSCTRPDGTLPASPLLSVMPAVAVVCCESGAVPAPEVACGAPADEFDGAVAELVAAKVVLAVDVVMFTAEPVPFECECTAVVLVRVLLLSRRLRACQPRVHPVPCVRITHGMTDSLKSRLLSRSST